MNRHVNKNHGAVRRRRAEKEKEEEAERKGGHKMI